MPGKLSEIADKRRPDYLIRRIKRLEDALAGQQTARTMQAAELGSGGIVVNGGQITIVDRLRRVLAKMGSDPDSEAIGVRTFRPSGGLMLGSMGQGDAGLSYTSIYDLNGNVAVNDDPVLGGLQRPYLPMGSMVRYTPPAGDELTTSTAYVSLLIGSVVRSNPRVTWDVIVSSSDASTTGNVRLVDSSGTLIGSVIAVPPNAVSVVRMGPVNWPAGSWVAGDALYLYGQAQVTAGTGTIGVRSIALNGRGFL